MWWCLLIFFCIRVLIVSCELVIWLQFWVQWLLWFVVLCGLDYLLCVVVGVQLGDCLCLYLFGVWVVGDFEDDFGDDVECDWVGVVLEMDFFVYWLGGECFLVMCFMVCLQDFSVFLWKGGLVQCWLVWCFLC